MAEIFDESFLIHYTKTKESDYNPSGQIYSGSKIKMNSLDFILLWVNWKHFALTCHENNFNNSFIWVILWYEDTNKAKVSELSWNQENI